MVKVAIIGASGFTGEKLIELLLGHPEAEISYLSAKLDKAVKFSELFPRFKGRLDIVCKNLDFEEASSSAEIFFLALPHRVSSTVAPFFLKRKKIVIDLSADYRLKDIREYKKFYKAAHADKRNLKGAVYGLTELYRDKIRKAKLVANPGCYPTASILTIAPLLRENLIRDIIIDAKSGITGAGRKASLKLHYANINGNAFSYAPFNHPHLPEIEEILSKVSKRKVKLRFTPHVIPAERGILITVYGSLTKKLKGRMIYNIYQRFYAREFFVRVLKDSLPQLKNVVETNFCDIGFQAQGREIVMAGAIDNLIKGASGQAVQNMNVILGLEEKMGLI